MLQAEKRKQQKITEVRKQEDGIYLLQEAGTLRLQPVTDEIIRVSYSDKEMFSTNQGAEYRQEKLKEYEDREEAASYILETGKLKVCVDMETGSVSFYRKDGECLLRERSVQSHRLEKFDVFRTVVNDKTLVKKVKTADGEKCIIQDAEQAYEKSLYHTTLYVEFDKEEAIYGLGQMEKGRLNLRHSTQYLHQANRKIAIPMLVSTKAYGILLSTQGGAVFQDNPEETLFYTEADEMLDYYFLAGESMQEVTGRFRYLTGKAVMLPRWAFGYMQSRERYESAQEITDTAERFRREQIGADVLILDWMSWQDGMWGQKMADPIRFPDQKAMIDTLHQMKFHFMVSIWPNMTKISDNYREMEEAGCLLPGCDTYNAFEKEARALYFKQVQEGWNQYGTDGWWCDSSEGFTPEWNHEYKPLEFQMYQEFVKETAKFMPMERANAFGMYHAMGIYEEMRKRDSKRRVVNLTRSGYPGSQKYGTILWSGDISASYQTLREQIRAGLNFCASGLPYWTLDIGAFFVKQGIPWYWDGEYEGSASDPAYRELYTRWYQLGAFLPIFRSHGTDCNREPWNFGKKGEPYYDAILKANQLRYGLLPYIYSLAFQVWEQDESMIKMLAFDFPGNRHVYEIEDQFLFGSSLMICPVTSAMDQKATRDVYLPEGCCWFDFWTRKRYAGGQTVSVSLVLDQIPVFVRAGAVIPVLEESIQSTEEIDGKDIRIQIYAGEDGTFTLYEDSGDGYGYEEGDFSKTVISYCEATNEVHWETAGNPAYRRGEFLVEIIGRGENCYRY